MAATDTGATVCLMGTKLYQQLRPCKKTMFDVDITLTAANDENMPVKGACFLEIMADDKAGKTRRTKQQVYILDQGDMDLYLSKKVCQSDVV